jgi:hypothetical protein
MLKMREPVQKTLLIMLLIYGSASLVHFTHNAEFLSDYPGLPVSWTRAGVYFAWIGLTIVGVVGWVLVNCGYHIVGLLILAIYAATGLDSLGHYVVASLSDHTVTMNLTILLEVVAAAFVLIEIVRQLARQISLRGSPKHDA